MAFGEALSEKSEVAFKISFFFYALQASALATAAFPLLFQLVTHKSVPFPLASLNSSSRFLSMLTSGTFRDKRRAIQEGLNDTSSAGPLNQAAPGHSCREGRRGGGAQIYACALPLAGPFIKHG
ncbi:hypothetical protein CEXT_318681 [Caerostris extrusa]|uniref:Uncharacterized protein n=1 Tax=Caerostris extrusa TaxID=172846 RepID=A0AAV4TWF3_CAEEX|nr:hypothetical protein CEXT_318681 [Caerostris extrusa]